MTTGARKYSPCPNNSQRPTVIDDTYIACSGLVVAAIVAASPDSSGTSNSFGTLALKHAGVHSFVVSISIFFRQTSTVRMVVIGAMAVLPAPDWPQMICSAHMRHASHVIGPVSNHCLPIIQSASRGAFGHQQQQVVTPRVVPNLLLTLYPPACLLYCVLPASVWC